jgi:hypothetical protein
MPPSPPADSLEAALVLRFVAEVMKRTLDAPTPEAFAQGVQAYCDELRPWLDPEDYPLSSQEQFTLLDYCEIDEAEDVWVRLSPEGYVFFRAWLRRKALLGLADEPGWN